MPLSRGGPIQEAGDKSEGTGSMKESEAEGPREKDGDTGGGREGKDKGPRGDTQW